MKINKLQEAIRTSGPVTEKMREQWDTTPDRTESDKIDKVRIWKYIRMETFEKISAKKVRLYQFVARAASILLLISMVGFAYVLLNKEQPEAHYIVHSGIQNISTIELADGTKIQLGSGSKLTYPNTFEGKTREVWIDGQAFIDVTPNTEKPFIVHTQQLDIEVVGTAFEVYAYADDDFLETILLEGKVKVTRQENKGDSFTLLPDDKITFSKTDSKIVRTKVNAENYTSWRKGFLSFENEKLSMIIPRLEQWYGRKIHADKALVETYKFTFKVRDEPLDRILYIMGESSPIRYQKSEEGDFTLFLNK